MDSENDIIDLTSTSTYEIRAMTPSATDNPAAAVNFNTNIVVINLDDTLSPVQPRMKSRKSKKISQVIKISLPAGPPKKRSRLGDCPICCEYLGSSQMASTICGHVFCMKCLKRTLTYDKKCPTCRGVLKNSQAYHPLYLN